MASDRYYFVTADILNFWKYPCVLTEVLSVQFGDHSCMVQINIDLTYIQGTPERVGWSLSFGPVPFTLSSVSGSAESLVQTVATTHM